MVLNEIANEIYNDSKAFPNYNRLEKLVSVEIGKQYRNNFSIPPMFSWLTGAEIREAIKEMNANQPLNIEDITEPSSINFKKFNYPEVEQVFPLNTDRDHHSKSKTSVVRQFVRKSIKTICHHKQFNHQPNK